MPQLQPLSFFELSALMLFSLCFSFVMCIFPEEQSFFDSVLIKGHAFVQQNKRLWCSSRNQPGAYQGNGAPQFWRGSICPRGINSYTLVPAGAFVLPSQLVAVVLQTRQAKSRMASILAAGCVKAMTTNALPCCYLHLSLSLGGLVYVTLSDAMMGICTRTVLSCP